MHISQEDLYTFFKEIPFYKNWHFIYLLCAKPKFKHWPDPPPEPEKEEEEDKENQTNVKTENF